jgi:hypothetical protein
MTAGVKLSHGCPKIEKYALNNELIHDKSGDGIISEPVATGEISLHPLFRRSMQPEWADTKPEQG